jgi:hypothetical protein
MIKRWLATAFVIAVPATFLAIGPQLLSGDVEGGPDSTIETGTGDACTGTPVSDGSVCADPGQAGCAGQGGGAGGGGQGGGASIALYVSNSQVTVMHGGFFTTYGGNGGPGGTGAPGGPSSTGSTGSNATCFQACDQNTCAPSQDQPLQGGAGGTATNGGGGGNGGGGAGGPTYFYVLVDGWTIDFATQDTLDASANKGTPGPGGDPNGPEGGAFVSN